MAGSHVATFTASGTWTAPSIALNGYNVTSIQLELWGAGGGGGAGATTSGGGGGGGGAYTRFNSYAVTPGQTYTITVGTSSPGASGGPTTFNGVSQIANGGGAGGAASGISGGSAGAGGAAASTGDVKTAGGAGGAGGLTAGNGGTAPNGGAGGTTGNPGTAPGGGGGGGLTGAGGAGGAGQVTITYAEVFQRSFPTTTVGVAQLPVKAIWKFATVQTVGVAGFSRRVRAFRKEAVTTVGVAQLVRRISARRLFTASTTGLVSLRKRVAKRLAVTTVGVVTEPVKVIRKFPSVTAVGIASVRKRIKLTRPTVTAGVPTFARRLIIHRALAAQTATVVKAYVKVPFGAVPANAVYTIKKIVAIFDD